MGRIRISVHPLFFLLGLYYLFTERIFEFVICSLTAVIHELGHSFVALNRGYSLNKIVMMPFGAVVKGKIKGLKLKDEAIISLAGPIVNLTIALFFISLWWFFPESYPYSEEIVFANFSIGIINLLPVYPLDGGRVVFALLSIKIGEKKATVFSKAVGVVISVGLLVAFLFTIREKINVSLLFFSLFVFFGNFMREKQNEYVRFSYLSDSSNLKRGVRINRIAVDGSVTIKRIMTLMDLRAMNEVVVFKEGEKIAVLEQKTLEKALFSGSIYSKIEEFL